MSSDEDSRELLAISSSTSPEPVSRPQLAKLSQLSQAQIERTNTTLKKIVEFCKINFFGLQNQFEQYVIQNEPNDCSLVAKYCKTVDIDLRKQSGISVDNITVNALHIPHPLNNFMSNEANQISPEDVDISKELQESPILVFIHGLGGQMSQFEPLMGLLSQCSEIMSLDLPGFGNSRIKFNDNYKTISNISNQDKQKISSSIQKMAWQDFTTENISNILYEFITQQIPDNKKVVLIGHSMGTHLSIKLTKKLPKHKVEGLILLSPPGLKDDVNITDAQSKKSSTSSSSLLNLLAVFTFIPWLFNWFRSWDRLEGLNSKSVERQLSVGSNTVYNKLRQLRWNMDVDSSIVLRYSKGFQHATTSDLATAISQFNDDPTDKHVYEKTLLLAGSSDKITPVKNIYKLDEFLTQAFFERKVSSTIEIKGVGHSLLLSKPEFISGMILNHIESRFPQRLNLSPAWVLKVKAKISGDKWGLKNELKWSLLKPISANITRKNGTELAPLLGMKTLREGDSNHSPVILEGLFYGKDCHNSQDIPRGNLIAIIDISADIPPYSPKSFNIIKYYKCATVSKVAPDQSAIRRFIQLVDDILSDNKVEQPLIAVHCHYGFNRTGFLVCCYLIEVLGWSVKEAVEGFKNAKPPGIKHPHFIDALYVRYESS
ncbi:Lipid droplet hydrolase 1 [Spathaspora sp. JA1]|nr:Lipid droplet hydrolase 1 [Spathaspora sp. JA1]